VGAGLLCLLLYHVPCQGAPLYPVTGSVVDGLESAIAQPPAPPPWWPLWTVI
jgi:hypothetical protein